MVPIVSYYRCDDTLRRLSELNLYTLQNNREYEYLGIAAVEDPDSGDQCVTATSPVPHTSDRHGNGNSKHARLCAMSITGSKVTSSAYSEKLAPMEVNVWKIGSDGEIRASWTGKSFGC